MKNLNLILSVCILVAVALGYGIAPKIILTYFFVRKKSANCVFSISSGWITDGKKTASSCGILNTSGR